MTNAIHSHCQQFAQAIRSDADDYVGAYFDSDQEFRNALAQFAGVKTDLHFDFSDIANILLRASLVMSDFTSLIMDGGSET